MLTRPLLRGTLALTAAGLYSRLTGSVSRIILVRLVGETGIGLFQMVVPVVNLAVTLGMLGLPGALAQMVAEAEARGDTASAAAVRRRTALLLTLAGALAAGALWLLTPLLVGTVLTDPRTGPAVRLAPLVVVAALPGAYLRACAQGFHELTPAAWSQVVEQTVRLAVMFGLAVLLLPHGVAAVAAGLVAALAVGEGAGSLWLLGWHRHRRRRPLFLPFRRPAPPAEVAPRLLALSLPLLAGGLLGSLTGLLDATLIPRRLLAAGFSPREATNLYGQFAGIALPTLFLPMVLVYPLTAALLPAVAAAAARGDRAALASHVRTAALLTGAVGALASLAFASVPGPIGMVLFGEADAAPLLALLAVAAPLTYVQQTLGAALTGLGLTALELRNYAAGLAVRTLLLLALTGNPDLGIRGAVLALAGGQGVMLLLHARALRRALA